MAGGAMKVIAQSGDLSDRRDPDHQKHSIENWGAIPWRTPELEALADCPGLFDRQLANDNQPLQNEAPAGSGAARWLVGA